MLKRELTGRRFGRLTVKEKVGSRKQRIVWACECDCGNTTEATTNKLTSGHTKSCGCYKFEFGVTHGRSDCPTYRSWKGMMARCYNEGHMHFPSYGGRGIAVCDRWHDFDCFVADMGDRPEGCSLDRINNDMGYSPENCQWSTAKEQANNRRNNTLLEVNGVEKTVSQWAEDLGTSASTIAGRINMGWSVEDAVTVPVNRNKELTFGGTTLNLSEWAKETGIAYTTIVSRFNRGLPPHEVLKGAAQ